VSCARLTATSGSRGPADSPRRPHAVLLRPPGRHSLKARGVSSAGLGRSMSRGVQAAWLGSAAPGAAAGAVPRSHACPVTVSSHMRSTFVPAACPGVNRRVTTCCQSPAGMPGGVVCHMCSAGSKNLSFASTADAGAKRLRLLRASGWPNIVHRQGRVDVRPQRSVPSHCAVPSILYDRALAYGSLRVNAVGGGSWISATRLSGASTRDCSALLGADGGGRDRTMAVAWCMHRSVVKPVALDNNLALNG
jgi:hypothetical protein